MGRKVFLRRKRRSNLYVDKGSHMEIHVQHKSEILVGEFDKEELPKVDIFYWSAKHDPHTRGFYLSACIVGQSVKNTFVAMHRLVMGEPKGLVVDHVDNNTMNNRKSNLRAITSGGNSQNLKGARKGNLTGVRGVIKIKGYNRFKVVVTVRYKKHHIGYFGTIEEAEKAAKEARAKLMPYSQEALSI